MGSRLGYIGAYSLLCGNQPARVFPNYMEGSKRHETRAPLAGVP